MSAIDYGSALIFPQRWNDRYSPAAEREQEHRDARDEDRCRCIAGDEARTAQWCPVHRVDAVEPAPERRAA